MALNIPSKITSLIFERWSWWWDGLTEHTTIKVLATLLAAILAISWLIKKSTRSIPPLPPGPKGLPLLGNLPFIESDFHLYLTQLSQIYGPIIKLQLGSKICIVIRSPSLAKQVFKDHDAIFSNRDPPAAGLASSYGGLGFAWSPDNGPEWRKLRRVCVHKIMSNASLTACYSLRRQEVLKMVKEISGKVGSPINIGDQMFQTVLNLLIRMLWGVSLYGEDRNNLGVQFRQMVEKVVELFAAPNISDLFPFFAWFDLQGVEAKIKKQLLWFDGTFESLIDNQMKVDIACGEDKNQGKGSKDLLQILLELKQQGDDKESLSMNQIKALFMDIILAGTDTTSTTVEWAMTELLRHPEKMSKACKELEQVVGNHNIVEEFHLDKLHYLHAILSETLRLHPSLPLIPRSPRVTCTLSGYTIPKGSRVIINVWAMNRDPEVWKNPPEFQPDRFMKHFEKVDYRGSHFNFLPFGSGRRICAGIPLAEKMVLYVLATLLHSFKWKLPKGTELELSEKYGFVLKKKNPLVAIPTAKSSTVNH